jgi:S1-C subfamily serine protease
LLLGDEAWAQAPAAMLTPPPALRAAVPLLCTENNRAAHTRVRGSGVIADSGGTLLTAAHVILQARFDCTLSVMIPDEEWTRTGRLRAFLVGDCHLSQPLDLAVCRIHPAENSCDWGYIRAARIRLRPATSGEPVWVTAFMGWGLFPLTRSGHITGRQNYQRQDGCRCDFATDITAVEGMSGSPVISSAGEVVGILTLAGKERFRGLSFGVSFEEAKSFLAAEGVLASSGSPNHEPL